MHIENPFHHKHRQHSHAAPKPARITDALLHIHYTEDRTVTTATIAGTTPITRVDGSALNLSDITAILVFDDIGDGNGPQQIGTVPNPEANFAFTTGVLAVATHTFTVIVDDDSGHASATSNAAQLTVAPTLANPSAVTNLTAVANPATPSTASSSSPAPTASSSSSAPSASTAPTTAST